MSQTSGTQPPFTMPPFDPAPMQAMWQQMMSQFARAGAPAASGAAPASVAQTSSEVLRQMQKAWLESMSRWAEEYLRSPQFLEQMKHSLENALAMRRQVEDFIRKASEQSFGSTLGVYDAVGAVRDAESWLSRRIDEVAERLDAIEEALGVAKPRRHGRTARSAPARVPRKRKKSAKSDPGKKAGAKRRR